MAERVARHLTERLGEAAVTAHHGSLAKEQRLDAEQRLKRGELKALVATASLELGIDIGDVDLVCQLGSPRSIASFLQRVGRSGHAVGGTAEGTAVSAVARRAGGMRGAAGQRAPRRARPADHPAPAAGRAGAADRRRGRGAGLGRGRALRPLPPRLALPRAWRATTSPRCVRMLAEGFTTRRGRRGALIHHDAVNHVLRGRRGARLTALTSGGTIPDTADYQVVLEPENQTIGTVNEDFAVESLAGDVFQLGNTSYRIMRVERGVVRVEDAHGQPPTIPFWLGEAPGRSDELSAVGVAPARRTSRRGCARIPTGAGRAALADATRSGIAAARGASNWSNISPRRNAALGCLPTQDTHGVRALLRRSRRHAARACTRRSAAASTAPGAWRCASASAASSTSSCRRRRPRTTSCCR